MITTTLLKNRDDAPDIATFETTPGLPPIGIVQISDNFPPGGPVPGYAHAHDFLVMAYFERGGGSLGIADQTWQIEAGDVCIVAPGEVIQVSHDAAEMAGIEGWAIFFPPEALGSDTQGGLLSWRTHPLLLPFVRGTAGGTHRLKIPEPDRQRWSGRCEELDLELRERRDGYHEAALAHLTLILVETGRLAADVVNDLKLQGEPLLAQVFGFIEEHYQEPISLKDVARDANLTTGHLTTLVRRKTGRTVQQWITERRMAEARRMLAGTNTPVEIIATQCGYNSPSYFVRVFKRTHGTTPLAWRRASRHQI